MKILRNPTEPQGSGDKGTEKGAEGTEKQPKQPDAKTQTTTEPKKTEPAPKGPEGANAGSDEVTTLRQSMAKLQGQLKSTAKSAYLTGLISPELAKLAPEVELDEDGQLTADSRAALDKWKADRPKFFEGVLANNNTQNQTGRNLPPVVSHNGQTLTKEYIAQVRSTKPELYHSTDFQKLVEKFYSTKG